MPICAIPFFRMTLSSWACVYLTTRQNVLRTTEAFRAQPATRWKSVTAPVKPVHKRIQPFESMIPVVIVCRVIGIPDRADRTGVAAGATTLDRIYLIHNGVTARQADVTFSHDSRPRSRPDYCKRQTKSSNCQHFKRLPLGGGVTETLVVEQTETSLLDEMLSRRYHAQANNSRDELDLPLFQNPSLDLVVPFA